MSGKSHQRAKDSPQDTGETTKKNQDGAPDHNPCA
jgi:hypothetical protein